MQFGSGSVLQYKTASCYRLLCMFVVIKERYNCVYLFTKVINGQNLSFNTF